MKSCFVALVFACLLGAQPKPGTGSIEGHVLRALTNAPVPKATVSLQTPEVWLTAYTDTDGRFQFTALPPGPYKLSAKHPGFLDRRARRPILIAQDEHVPDAELRLAPQSVITGRVLDEDGDPVGGAQIAVYK
jgi:protocatechuate 3,4-dioxygenase beta subunit